MKKLENKVALITGAAQGIGAESALRMAEEGALVIIADLSEELGIKTVDLIKSKGGKADFIKIDVTKEEEWINGIAEIKSKYGALHILVNNAGIGRPSPITEMSYETFRLVFAINLDGMFLGMKHAIPLMTQSNGGSIINLSSTASKKAYANMSAYCASKAGLAHLTKVAALECAQNRTGIRVNSIHPGIIETPAWDSLGALNGADPSTKIDLDQMAEATVALGYKGKPKDIANAIIYLASEESSYVTGSELTVDGGQALL
ncbi:SDR family NAD(P)-dependent oxidoreductase [Pontibacter diazotrophicus]|uniref:SDR family NAD(P)-dependent oxidoreductase n=1 Tax=Pontibacter diazotrophicus TaxID=1400979 RepID=A0A3D8L7P9_9BACT|nr:SDR family NAD(P)-dependent oxidoreductase [Pontibacter diazotrophicus]RDV13316.1 SDR family NAD(P)-dependent oxidoreductase [Pontibacter diazotrophicus]